MQQPDSVPVGEFSAMPISQSVDPSEIVLLGKITGIYGLQGWVKVHSDTMPRENIVNYPSWLLGQSGGWKAITVKSGRPQGKTLVAQLEGIFSPEQASELIGSAIAVQRSALPSLAAGEYYWADLTGMRVRTTEGVDVGTVARLFETGANDVVVITDTREGASESSNEILVPWLVPDVITEVDLESRLITIDWDPDF